MFILACNVGSTSLKFKLYDMPVEKVMCECRIESVGSENASFSYINCQSGETVRKKNEVIRLYSTGVNMFLKILLDKNIGVIKNLRQIQRVAFKTVLAKGYYGVHELTDDVLEAMKFYYSVALSHNRPYVDTIGVFRSLLPNALLIGVFETAFHTTIPIERRMYSIPYEWYEKYGIQRMGYHGASHEYISEIIFERYGEDQKIISCHLGGSCSVCAIDQGKSVDNSFGFSLQTGIFHANRIGDVDPYIYPYLISEGLTIDEINDGLGKRGGLLGISGVSNDLRVVEAEALENNKRAQLAMEMFCCSLIRYIGAFYAELKGLDRIVFTGGIGENSSTIRKGVCDRLGHLGIQLSEERNLSGNKDRIISTDSSLVSVHIIPTNEELGIARRAYEYLV